MSQLARSSFHSLLASHTGTPVNLAFLSVNPLHHTQDTAMLSSLTCDPGMVLFLSSGPELQGRASALRPLQSPYHPTPHIPESLEQAAHPQPHTNPVIRRHIPTTLCPPARGKIEPAVFRPSGKGHGEAEVISAGSHTAGCCFSHLEKTPSAQKEQKPV